MNRTGAVVAAVVLAVVAAFTAVLWAHPDAAPAMRVATRPPPTAASNAPSTTVAPDQPAPASTRPAVERAPIQRLALDRDLFATYLELQRSNRGGDLYVARGILSECYLLVRAMTSVREIATGRVLPMRKEPPKPVQIDAATDLLARCHGFETMTNVERQQALADLDTRLNRAEDPVGWGEALASRRRTVSDDLLRAILASQDPVAIEDISMELADRWRKATNQPVDGDEDALRFEEAIFRTLVSCDLGRPCGSDSIKMRERCAFDPELCGIDVRTATLADFPPDVRSKVDEQVAIFVRAIQDNDFALWGL